MKHFVSRMLASTVFLFALSAVSNAEAKVEVGQKFPAIKLKALDGKKAFNPSTLKGKIVLVDFWASWCEPCKVSMPFLNELAQKYKGKIEVVGINVDEDAKAGAGFLKENPAPHIKFVSDAKQEFIKQVGVATMPSSFILDKNGSVKVAHQGFNEGKDKPMIEEEIKKLLKAK